MLSKITYWITFVILSYLCFTFYPRWEHGDNEATISWDASGYYTYLPAFIIYKDVKQMKFHDSLMHQYKFTPYNTQYKLVDSFGNKTCVYTIGQAINYLPFFLIAHSLATSLGYAADGYSLPYQVSISLGALLMGLIGLYYLRKVLLEYFSEVTTSITMLILVFATNYLNYIIIDAGMTHCWIFSWLCILLYHTIQFYKKPTTYRGIGIGAIVGFITIIRPTDFLCILIPLCWNLHTFSIAGFKHRLAFILEHFQKYLSAFIVGASVISIQFMYWKYTTGDWYFYSYSGEGFSWTKPHFMDYIFSYRSGWLTYTPIMYLAIFGIYFILREKFQQVTILITLACTIWYVTAWEIWWYGGRAMLQSYAMWVFPLAFVVENLQKNIFSRILLSFLFVFGLSYNYWFTKNIHGGIIDYSNMTKNYFWRSLGKYEIDKREKKFLEIHDYYDGKIKDSLVLFKFNKKNISIGTDSTFESNLRNEEEILFNSSDSVLQQYEWARLRLRFQVTKAQWDQSFMHTMQLILSQDGNQVRSNTFKLERVCDDTEIVNEYLDIKLSKTDFDKLEWIIKKPKLANNQLYIHSAELILFCED